ncbi:hypothetical protein B9479_005000 [Cryptococcus floricola]|uniref:Uncharacterized protein n=1 Tax=Cryptococcus floricola TaxID=2591691 RepID=A0A5D3ASE1_9TREE|nr:hypothetical protein B9479_005000 [Cryptococcus floricola]
MNDRPSESSSYYDASNAGEGSCYTDDWDAVRRDIDQTLLLWQEDEEDVTETNLDYNFSVGPEDLDLDDFKDDAEDVTETGKSLEEEEAPGDDEEAKREADEKRKARKARNARNAIKRKQNVLDDINRRTERFWSSAAHVTMTDLKHQLQKLDEYDAEIEAQITASLLSGTTISLPGTDATKSEEATSENKSMPGRMESRRWSGDKESRRRKALDQFNAKERAKTASNQHEKDLLMAKINERTFGSRKATRITDIEELKEQLARLDDRDKKRVESVRARLINDGRLS